MQTTTLTMTRLFEHEKRKDEWGYAILAYERDDTRSYLFQDGKLRRFKKSHCHLLVPASPDDGVHISRNLKAMLRSTMASKASAAAAPGAQRRMPPSRAYDAFLQVHPDGLKSADYARDVRGVDAKRRLKRHRDAAVAEATELLSKRAIVKAQKAGAHAEVRDTLVRVLANTDLVTKKQLAPLEKLDDAALPDLVDALARVLHGDGPFEARFERFVHVLERSGESVSWELATAPAALVHPEAQLYVKASAMKLLASRVAPALGFTSTPSGFVYGRLVEIADELVHHLAEVDDLPRDFFDVTAIVETATKPKLRDLLVTDDE